MEGLLSPPISSAPALTQEDICENATILDEGLKLCPLCASEVRMFFINFNEKIQMCENAQCEYPFGHENIVYAKEDDVARSDEEVASFTSKTVKGSNATLSVMSTAAWSEISKINHLIEAEQLLESQTEIKDDYLHKTKYKKIEKEEDSQQGTLQKVEEIKKLNKELVETNYDIYGKPHLKNEKWLKNLMCLQKLSGMTLLKPEEIKLLERKKPEIDTGELKIDINVGDESKMSTVKIEISNLKT